MTTVNTIIFTALLICFAGVTGKHDRWEVRARGKGLQHIMNYHPPYEYQYQYPKKQEEHHEPKVMYYPIPYQMPYQHQSYYEKPQQDETKLTIIPLFTGGHGFGSGGFGSGNGNYNGFGPVYI